MWAADENARQEMTAFQRDALQNFVDDGAKEHPPVFVDRTSLLNEIRTKATRTFARKIGINR